jgi:nucleotide-binding universal stress UspA family protein
MEFRRILVPFDFSEPAEHAVRYAVGLADHFDAEVTLMHVLAPLQYDFSMTEPTPERLQEVNLRRLANAGKALRAIQPSLECHVIQGEASDEIIAAANAEFDLVVMSTRGASALRRMFMIGSVTSKVLHGCERPVITSLHFETSRQPMEIRQILCAIDLGTQSSRVLCWGSRAARSFGADLEIAHAAGSDHTEPGAAAAASNRATTRIHQLQSTLGIEAPARIMLDPPARAISALARKTQADLVVLGRGVSHDAIGRLRATAYDIIRQCPCPVASI